MSWFKKVLTYLQGNDEETIEPSHTNEKQPLKRSDNDSKTVETKMIYQYPKGEFRFPLIPDEQKEKQAERRRREEADAATEKERERREALSKQREKENKPKRPFTPTDVPSPIYGFGPRPSAKAKAAAEDAIEYELDEVKKRRAAATLAEDLLAAKQNEPLEESAPSNVVPFTPHPNEEVSSHVEPEPQKQVEDSITLIPRVEETAGQEKEESTEEPSIEVHHEEEGMDDLASHAALEPAEPDHENKEEPFALAVPEESAPDSKPEEEVHSEAGNGSETAAVHTHIVEEEPAAEAFKPEEAPAVERTDAVKEEPVRPRRRVPFNVMMRKQDRQKLANRTATPEKKEEPPAEQDDDDLAHFVKPSLSLLSDPVHEEKDEQWLKEQSDLLDETLFHFNVNATVQHVTQGPAVTRFELHPERGVKVSKVTSLTDDIKLNLAAKDIRMEAPIPGKNAIGIEIPNPKSRPVALKEILAHDAFQHSTATLPVALGLDIEGSPVVTDIGKMPHGLIAGATGSGKSVCINSILVSLLYHASPDDVKMLLIDPKMVELAPYNHIPHLVSPVITDVKAATAALKWAVEEMERRYQLFAHAGVRDITRYNKNAVDARQFAQKLPYLVIVIDELADLMMMAPADVEEAICRIAQKARACGIHLLIATQRPSVDVITGLIKANVPTRVAFSVSSQVDSRTIIDTAGADRLLGKGDMLFLGNGASKPVRLQGTFVSDDEIDAVVAHVRSERPPAYLFHQEELLAKAEIQEEEDELLMEACEFVIEQGGASTSLLQRQFRIGYNRAARLIDLMEKRGWVSEARGSKPRTVLLTTNELAEVQESYSS